jgi:hypothetical protein
LFGTDLQKMDDLIYFALNILRIEKIAEHVDAGDPLHDGREDRAAIRIIRGAKRSSVLKSDQGLTNFAPPIMR